MKALILIFILCPAFLFAQMNWELQKEKSDIKVWTKDYPDSKFKRFKAQTTIEANIEAVVAVFLDIENMNLWYDRIENVQLVKKYSKTEGTYRIDFDLPWPVKDRISGVRATLKHDANTNIVKVHTEYEEGIAEETDNALLVTKMYSDWTLTPLAGGLVSVYHEGYMDPVGSIPAWIANTGVIDGPIKTLNALINIIPNYSSIDVSFID